MLALIDGGVLPRVGLDLYEAPALGGDGRKRFQFARKREVDVLIGCINRGSHAACEWHKERSRDTNIRGRQQVGKQAQRSSGFPESVKSAS